MIIRRVYCHFGCGYQQQQQQGAECNNIKNEKKLSQSLMRDNVSPSVSRCKSKEFKKKKKNEICFLSSPFCWRLIHSKSGLERSAWASEQRLALLWTKHAPMSFVSASTTSWFYFFQVARGGKGWKEKSWIRNGATANAKNVHVIG